MKHLCIINPKAGQVRGHVYELVLEINAFFLKNPRMDHAVHITRWKRDASGFAMRYVKNASEMVRVYAFGGGGTLFEVINGVMGLPNVQIAYYPLGRDDDLLTVFGKNSGRIFKSLRNLSLSSPIAIDTILAGNHYALANITIGIGAISYQTGMQLSERLMLPLNASYNAAGIYYAFIKKSISRYRIEMEDIEMEGDYAGIFIANISGNGGGSPAPEARFNDGIMDIYAIKQTPRNVILRVIMDYQTGNYAKWPQYINHYRCKKLKISSPKDMTMILDGEIFYYTEINLEIKPASINFICPLDIDQSVYKQLAAYSASSVNTQGSGKSFSLEETFLPEEFTVSDLYKNGEAP